jgi:hypothetical protein
VRAARKRLSIIFFVTMTACIVFSCKTTEIITEQAQTPPHKRLESYEFDPGIPLIDRVSEIPDFVLSYYRNAENMPSYSPYIPSGRETEEIKRCLERLPKIPRRILEERMVGIYFLENFINRRYDKIVYQYEPMKAQHILARSALLDESLSGQIE